MPIQAEIQPSGNRGIAALAAMVRELSLPELEEKMLTLAQADCPVIHRFSPGLYIRELFLPEGVFAIGHRQRYEHLNLFLRGRMMMLHEDGRTEELAAPMIFTGKPGRKMGYVMEDTVWLNIYPTNIYPTTETDVAKLEETFLDKSDQWRAAYMDRLNRMGKRVADNRDYAVMLAELGVDGARVRAESENIHDQIPMPDGDWKFIVADSAIEGRGVFATADVAAGEEIGPARINGMRTPLGRYVNHAAVPNAVMEAASGDVYLRALVPLSGAKGGYPGDEITTDYRNNFKLRGLI
jgi:hypothetical protein